MRWLMESSSNSCIISREIHMGCCLRQPRKDYTGTIRARTNFLRCCHWYGASKLEQRRRESYCLHRFFIRTDAAPAAA